MFQCRCHGREEGRAPLSFLPTLLFLPFSSPRFSATLPPHETPWLDTPAWKTCSPCHAHPSPPPKSSCQEKQHPQPGPAAGIL